MQITINNLDLDTLVRDAFRSHPPQPHKELSFLQNGSLVRQYQCRTDCRGVHSWALVIQRDSR